MGSISEATSIRFLADSVVSSLAGNEFVVIAFPPHTNLSSWIEPILSALDGRLSRLEEGLSFYRHDVNESQLDPACLTREWDCAGSLEKFVSNYGPEPVAICFDNLLWNNLEWREFFSEVASLQRQTSGADQTRYLVALIKIQDSETLSQFKECRTFAFWNALKWEDQRVLAQSLLDLNESALSTAWRVATYTGACNGDPFLLQKLCKEHPVTLEEVIVFVQRNSESNLCGAEKPIRANLDQMIDAAWQIPRQFHEDWAEHGLVQYTVERGSRRALDAGFDYGIRKHIWQEQVAGLFPLIIEVSHLLNVGLDKQLLGSWREQFANSIKLSIKDSYFVEPSQLQAYLTGPKKRKVTDTSWNLLNSLRTARNRLAHMEPIELSALVRIWDLYKRMGS